MSRNTFDGRNIKFTAIFILIQSIEEKGIQILTVCQHGHVFGHPNEKKSLRHLEVDSVSNCIFSLYKSNSN